MFFNILTFDSYISGVYFWVFVIILVEIKIDGFLWKCVKKASIYGRNHKAEQVPSSERL